MALTLWVEAPAGLAAGTSYILRVDNPATADPGITSTATFLSTTGAGGCAPTITSFTPTCASAGDTVMITGNEPDQDADLDGADRVVQLRTRDSNADSRRSRCL